MLKESRVLQSHDSGESKNRDTCNIVCSAPRNAQTRDSSSQYQLPLEPPIAGTWYSSSEKLPSSLLTLQASMAAPGHSVSPQGTSTYSPEGSTEKFRMTSEL